MASSEFLLAVAGSGKTESIIDRCIHYPKRRLIITYTTNGQLELENRLRQALADGLIDTVPEVMGWYKFLIEHFLKPYLPVSQYSRIYRGFHKDYDPGDKAPGDIRYFDPDGRVGGERLAYVAAQVQSSSKGLPVSRLAKIYEEIVIDEAQDLVATDLVLLEEILASDMSLYMVGDVRQIVYETNRKDAKYRKYRGLGKLDWIREKADKGQLTFTEQTVNYRSCEPIVALANQVFDPALGLLRATSGRVEVPAHHGVFYIKEDEVETYQIMFNPMPLRWDKRSGRGLEHCLDYINFGESKGLQADHVLIVPSKPIRDFLAERNPIKSMLSAAKLYVAITRARHSLAFVMPDNAQTGEGVTWW